MSDRLQLLPPPTTLDEALARFPVGAVEYGHEGEPATIAQLRRRALPGKVYVAAPPSEALARGISEALAEAGFRVVDREAPALDDFPAMAAAEVCLLVLAEGLEVPELFEAGWFAASQHKRLVILALGPEVPARARRLADAIVTGLAEALAELDRQVAELRSGSTTYGRGDAVVFSTRQEPERVSLLLGCLGFHPVPIPAEDKPALDSWGELVEELTTPAALLEVSSEVAGAKALLQPSADTLLATFQVDAERIQAGSPGELVLVEAEQLAQAFECVWISGRREALNSINNPRGQLSAEDIDALGAPARTQLSIEFEDPQRVVLWVELDGEEQRQTLRLPEGMVHGSVVIRIATALETMLRAVTGADSISPDACKDTALEAYEASLRF